MYDNKLAVAIKSAGKVCREFKDTVYLPFGSEFSIFVKNLNSVRAQVNITVDGQQVITGLVVNPNSEVEVERFVKNNDKGNRLKFIERTANIENHRGIKIEDGLVRVEFQFEKVSQPVVSDQWADIKKQLEIYNRGKEAGRNERWPWPQSPYPSSPYWQVDTSYFDTSTMPIFDSSASAKTANVLRSPRVVSTQAYNLSSTTQGYSPADYSTNVGITVPGSISTQQFTYVPTFALDSNKHVIVLRLLGQGSKGQQVKQAITVKHKPDCPTCGKKNKATAKFCSECGTALEVI